MVKFQLRHGNDLLAMDSLRDCDVRISREEMYCIDVLTVFKSIG